MYWKYDTAFFRNYQFWDEIWHLGGQIKMKIYSNPIIPIYHFDMRSGIWGDRSNIGGADQHENLKMFIQISQLFILRWNQAYKGSDQALVQINVPRYLFEIHYLLSSHQFGKDTVDMDFSFCCSIPQQREPWCCCHWSGLSTLITLRSQIRASSWTFSPTSIFQRSPPQLAVTFLHFCLKPEITFDTMASLHEHLHRVFCIVVTLRGFEAVQSQIYI